MQCFFKTTLALSIRSLGYAPATFHDTRRLNAVFSANASAFLYFSFHEKKTNWPGQLILAASTPDS
jgi:hypothetical protein